MTTRRSQSTETTPEPTTVDPAAKTREAVRPFREYQPDRAMRAALERFTPRGFVSMASRVRRGRPGDER